ncbi:hypothetical protein [Hymenobacter sp. BT190]|uniref:hypothetical protein n=1 Tax=Hymenobacter sp. BT190 TaxID=2763505 RepID=UPI0016515E0C|nr:hypothetical protein [Hymenobacter sp. BT190]MBC6698063.1 hypothetical protein [Hymenobacter sp. BT190]
MNLNLIPSGPAFAGLLDIFLVEQRYLGQLPISDGLKLTNPLQLLQDRKFSVLRSTIYSATFDSEGGTSLQGNSYKQELAGFFPGDDTAAGEIFAYLNGRRFVVLARAFDGQLRLIGDRSSALEFSSKFSSGGKPGQRKGWSWSFAGITQRPAYYYSAVFEVEELGTMAPPPGAGSGFVQVRDRRGRLRANIPAGRTLIISSPFRVSLQIQ